jgi:Single Cache domain 2
MRWAGRTSRCRIGDWKRFAIRKFIYLAASAAIFALSPTAFAEPSGGTADEAKAMLKKAVAAVRADEAKALDMFDKGEGGFRDRDLYVFCTRVSDGTIVATGNPNLKEALGADIRGAQNSTGKSFGAEIYAAIQKPEGQITEVSYMFPRPGADDTPVARVTLVERADDDLGCGVGYYK